ncbi:ABC transporter permease [Paractinoplanes rishiriensis]|uniref:Dipeptide-transport integral membrane protein ABC transporter DppB n=1 Tax=Paractinoplanes rishiriensis TaxID=1050105 RepID=A0A919N1E2_9ACTN|nr:ABC transporter permease [Actinoplanes rishiriensis]GIF01226.1 putative dipeptide-transport integral membrane protein ABC transporter DppB [Actinoplanes rishiriensis]
MLRYTLRRLLLTVPVLIGTTFLVFAMVFAIPGDPIRALAGDRPMAEGTYLELRDRYHLDDPLLVQYGKYMWGLLQGDFGQDFNGRAVAEIMAERFPVTIKLALVALAFEVLLGIAGGVLAAIRRKSFLDSLVLITTTAIVSIPTFVLGFTLQLVLGVRLGWFPIAGLAEGWRSYLLPGFVLGALSLAYVARLTRTSLVENLRADYVRTATAKGARRSRVVGIHALRNSLIPVVTFLGVDLGALMGGAIVTEGIFNLPGVGQQVFLSVRAQEGPVVVGIVTALVLVFVLANLAVDLLYGLLDPRIRYE